MRRLLVHRPHAPAHLLSLVILVLSLGLAAAGPAQAAKRHAPRATRHVHRAKRHVPRGFFGTVLDPMMTNPAYVSDRALDAQTALMARSGVESLRVTFDWGAIEPAPGKFDFLATDRIVLDAARHGLHLLANLIYTPAWASTHPSGSYPFRYAPRRPQYFATFASALVHRYGPRGSFWKLHPGLRSGAVREWQIWNEQGFDVFWDSLPWPPRYTRLLRAGYLAIHHVDRGAQVVAGSLVATGPYTQWAQMSALYRAGAKRYFDVVSVHPFTDGSIPVSQSVDRAVTIVRYVRNVMRRHGDGRKPIILTELTWPGAVGFVKPSRLLGLETTPRGEMLRLTAAYNYLATHIRQTGVTQAYWFDWASTFDRNDPQSDVGYRFAGLTRFDNGAFFPQPVLRTYARVATHYEGCAKLGNGRCR